MCYDSVNLNHETMSSKIKINETHICTLKKNNRLLEVENIELQFEFENSFKEIEIMAENPNRNKYDLESTIINSSLKALLNRFSFCQILSKPYQGIKIYKTIDYNEYKKKLLDYKRTLLNRNFDKEKTEKEIARFQKEEKENLIENFIDRKTAYTLEKAYEKCEKDDKTLAFSHRKVGYAYPKFKLGDNFDVIYKSNFGFGSVSYFYTHIKYKNIDILPYSDWIKYRYAKKYDIIRYTRRHRLQHFSWFEAFEFTTNLFNHSVTNPTRFVNEWIINECAEMVSGLEYLLNKNEEYQIQHSYSNPKVKYRIDGIELLDLKGEKISGALSFLDKIRELTIFSDTINSFIERIKSCNLSIYPQLENEIDILSEKISKYKSIKRKWKKKSIKIKKRKKYISKKLYGKKKHNIKEKAIKKYLKEEYPKYKKDIKKCKKAKKLYKSIKNKLSNTKKHKTKFDNYISIINKQLKL
jgi:hypothetical protein